MIAMASPTAIHVKFAATQATRAVIVVGANVSTNTTATIVAAINRIFVVIGSPPVATADRRGGFNLYRITEESICQYLK